MSYLKKLLYFLLFVMLAAVLAVALLWLTRINVLNALLPWASQTYLDQHIKVVLSDVNLAKANFKVLELIDYDLKTRDLNVTYPSETQALMLESLNSELNLSNLKINCANCNIQAASADINLDPFLVKLAKFNFPKITLDYENEIKIEGALTGTAKISPQTTKIIGSGFSPQLGQIEGDYEFHNGNHNYQISSSLNLSKNSAFADTLVNSLSMQSGALNTQIICSPEQAKIKATSNNLNFTYDKTIFQDVTLNLSGQLLGNTEIVVDINAKNITAAIPLQNLKTKITYQQKSKSNYVNITRLSANALGGLLTLQPHLLKIPVARCEKMTLNLKNLDITDVLAFYKNETVKATGQLSGSVPFQICPKLWQIEKSNFYATTPGRIQIAKVGDFTNPALKLAFQALQDFSYDKMAAELDIAQNGDMIITFKINGVSHSLNKNTPIVVNLNVEDNLFALMKSLQISSKVSERIQKHLEGK